MQLVPCFAKLYTVSTDCYGNVDILGNILQVSTTGIRFRLLGENKRTTTGREE